MSLTQGTNIKKIYLCGHTGSSNRGCEAIVRSTVIILQKCGAEDIYLISSGEKDDIRLGVDKVVKIIPHPQKSAPAKIVTVLRRKLFRDPIFTRKSLKTLKKTLSCSTLGAIPTVTRESRLQLRP